MPQRLGLSVLLAAAVAFAWPSTASASAHLPFTLGLGYYVPTSPSSNVEEFATFPGTTVRQTGNVSLEFSVGPELRLGSYQLTALFLSQRQSVTPLPPPGLGPTNQTVTQIPLMFEDVSDQIGSFRFGGGLGYDFVSSAASGGKSTNGIVGDTFLQVGVASNAAVEAKYIFGQRAALGGVFLGITTRL